MLQDLIACSPAMRQVVRLAGVYASSSSPMLLTGETGTGKTVLARWIHEKSPRAAGPFEARNCAALSEMLALSDLFGHTKGAFTGADRNRDGAFQRASGGTLFLDEVSRLFPVVQGSILKAIDEGTIQAVGSDDTGCVDVRLIAATNQNLWAMADDNGFAFDLLQRLAVLTIEVPPLRDRLEDLVPLAYRFLAANQPFGTEVSLADECQAVLRSYHYPGNLRELAAIMEECRLLARPEVQGAGSKGIITAAIVRDVISRRGRGRPEGLGLSHRLADVERRARERELTASLERNSWNITQVAADLGVSRQTVSKWIRQFSLRRM